MEKKEYVYNKIVNKENVYNKMVNEEYVYNKKLVFLYLNLVYGVCSDFD